MRVNFNFYRLVKSDQNPDRYLVLMQTEGVMRWAKSPTLFDLHKLMDHLHHIYWPKVEQELRDYGFCELTMNDMPQHVLSNLLRPID